MKAILFISLFILLGESQHEDDLATAIKRSNFVGFVHHDPLEPNENDFLKPIEIFRGDVIFFIGKGIEININDKRIYLIVGDTKNMLLSTLNFPVKAIADLSAAEIDILQAMPCYDDSVKKAYQNTACHRNFEPVCGCDNKEYGNVCEMKQHGIVRFSPGRCKK